jgi:hypothetical protein
VGFLLLLWKWFDGEVVFHVKHLGLRVSEFELYGSDLLLEPWCRVVEDGRMVVNCYAFEEEPHGSMKKNTNLVCFHGGGEFRKKKKLRLFHSWRKLLEWLWAALDPVSTSRFKCVGPGLKLKCGNRVRTKAMVKKISTSLRSSLVDSDPSFLCFYASSEPGSVPAQPQRSSVAFLSISGDFTI